MTAPTDRDTSAFHGAALDEWIDAERSGRRAWNELFDAQVFGVRASPLAARGHGYPPSRLHFAEGPVEETLPAVRPAEIALLRLDTDWYESTRHELVHLYPALTSGGVLLIDDYGHWDGCRRAVDEYFADEAPALLLNRVDYTGRIAVKC